MNSPRTVLAGFAAVAATMLLIDPSAAVAQAAPVAAKTVQPNATQPDAILPDAEKEKEIRQLIALSGGDKIGTQMMDQMIPAMRKMLPQVPAEFWQEFRRKAKVSQLVDRLLPIYDKYYSREDVKGLIQFYQTPLGQKVIAVAPAVSKESYAVGSAWGEQMAREVIEEYQAREKAAAKPAPTGKSGASAAPVRPAR